MTMTKTITTKYKSLTHYVLAALVPYSQPNLKLVFSSKHFFADLYKIDRYKNQTLRNAYHRCIKQGLVEIDTQSGMPTITAKGKKTLSLYKGKYLKNSQLMVIFDIPEVNKYKRQQLRLLLKQLEFKQVQKSVWVSQKDSREYLNSEIKRLNLNKDVLLFECHSI